MQLSDIKTTDLGGIEPYAWWAKLICRAIGARTFHWLKFICHIKGDWIVSESISKGAALTRLGNRKVLVYRIKGLDHEPIPMDLIAIHSKYGDYPYDWDVAFKTAVWWLLKHYFGKVIKVVRDKEVNCQEWVVLYGVELGVRIIPDDEYPMCINLEQSPFLEFIGEVEGEVA